MTKAGFLIFAVIASAAALWTVPAGACTAFLIDDGRTIAVGRNLDWELDLGLLVARPRDAAQGRIHGNMVVCQLGTDLPLGGVNEAGLVVEELSYAPARTPAPEGLPAVDEFRWIGLQLDRRATVAEVVAALDEVAVERRWMGLHYFVADRTGDAAVVEFLDGAVVVHRGDDLPHPVLANDTYANSLRYLKRHRGFGGDRVETDGPESPERFVRAARAAAECAGGDATAAAFATLASVAQHDTRWSLVYEPRRPALHVKVRGRRDVLTVPAADLALDRPGPVLVRDLAGGVAPETWTPWSPAVESALRARVYEALGLDRRDEGVLDAGPPTAPSPGLEAVHLQNAGVALLYGHLVVAVDALFDLTAEDGRPPRLHDHLSAVGVRALLAGELTGDCLDVALATHGHDDHHGSATARRLHEHCPEALVATPVGVAGGDRSLDVPFGVRETFGVGPVRVTALGLRHGPDDDLPHLGYVVHLGPWDVVHLGDACLSPENLELLEGLPTAGRRLVLVPWWFVTEAEGRRWLRESSKARRVMVLHANRGNVDEVTAAIAAHADALPPVVLPERLERVRCSD